jgi:YVTN family beta-propeller protein
VLAHPKTAVRKGRVEYVVILAVVAAVGFLLVSGLASAQVAGRSAGFAGGSFATPPPPTASKNITVGKEPTGVAYDPASNLIFVTNYGSATVSVISGTAVVKTLHIGKDPETIIYDPKNTLLYTVNSGSSNVSVINGTTEKVIGTISGFATLFPVTVYDPSNGAVYLFSHSGVSGASTMYRLPTSTPWTFTSIRLGDYSDYATYDPATTDLVVSNELSSNLSIVNSASNAVSTIALKSGSYPGNSVYNPTNKDVYIVNEGNLGIAYKSGNVTVVGSANTVVKTVSVAPHPITIALNPSNHDVYVLNVTIGSVGYSTNCTVTPITSGNSAKKAIPVGNGAYYSVYDPNNNEMYVTESKSNVTAIISGTTLLTTLTTKGNPQAAAYDPGTTDMILVQDTASKSPGQLTLVSSPTSGKPAIVGTQVVGDDPTSYAYDPSNMDAYVSNYNSKSVTEF